MRKLIIGSVTSALLFGSALTATAIADDVDCSDFSSQSEAQNVLNQDLSDPNNLDQDDNGIACESLANLQDDNSVPTTNGSQVREVPQGSLDTGRW